MLDKLPLGVEEEDEEGQEATDRAHWEKKSSVLAIVDEFMETLKEIDSNLDLNYNKFFIGLL